MREAPDLYTCFPEDVDFEDGTALTASTLSFLETEPARKSGTAQWLAYIASQAFFDLQENMALDQQDYSGIGMFVSLPQRRPDWGPGQEEDFVYHFHNTIEKDAFSHSQFSFCGHAGAIELIEPACAMLENRQIQYALIGGVESYLFADWLEILDAEYRIKSDRNPDGFTPGEGSAWMLLEPEGQPQKRNVRPLTTIKGVNRGKCDGVDLTYNTGMVLSEVLKELLPEQEKTSVVFCDLNGEPARAKEWGYALTRLAGQFSPPPNLEHPADCLGDLGAASGAVLTGMASQYVQKYLAPGETALVWTASDNGQRAALILEYSQ